MKRLEQLTRDEAMSAIAHRLNYNPGAISLPLLGFQIGAGHTAFPGDKVWDGNLIFKEPLTLLGWGNGPRYPKNWRVLLVEENECNFYAEELFPSRLLAAQHARTRVLRLFKKRRKWMRIYRAGVRDIDRIIKAETRSKA